MPMGNSINDKLNKLIITFSYTIRKAEHMGDKSKWSSNCSSSGNFQISKHLYHSVFLDEEDDEEFQTSKIKSLQIKPINESQSQINSSVDELRNAIGHITLQRSSTFEKVFLIITILYSQLSDILYLIDLRIRGFHQHRMRNHHFHKV